MAVRPGGYIGDVHIEDAVLERAIGQLDGRDLANLEVRAALLEIISAMPALFDVDGAGVLLVDENQVLRYVASTDTSAQLLEAAQEASGTGPCVEALVDNVTVAVVDLLDDGRWRDLAAVLVPNGIRSVLGVPVRLAGTPIGSLNVYKGEAHVWDDSDRGAIAAFDRLVERLVAGAVATERKDALISQLQHALQVRVSIERAVGVLIATEDVKAPAAFERLRRAARSSRRSVRDIADEVVLGRGLA
jgi:GAF domain-containing protein